eukprot:TRINITY_DN778303_c0_g1_i1.p1 TRINITY_DN778303_c0_g1~~TRINITY_DN778303_c0_g1_i1.p1  ORF type:complete len:174 (-),score=36.84 TRINITY_DN778303_c0_g1_i1:168-689(-)
MSFMNKIHEISDSKPRKVALGDQKAIKQAVDDGIEYYARTHKLEHEHKVEDIQLIIMLLAIFVGSCSLFLVKFPEQTVILGICCVSYFSLTTLLQLYTTKGQSSVIVFTKDFNFHSAFPEGQEEYELVVERKSDRVRAERLINVGVLFDEDGYFARRCFLKILDEAVRELRDE